MNPNNNIGLMRQSNAGSDELRLDQLTFRQTPAESLRALKSAIASNATLRNVYASESMSCMNDILQRHKVESTSFETRLKLGNVDLGIIVSHDNQAIVDSLSEQDVQEVNDKLAEECFRLHSNSLESFKYDHFESPQVHRDVSCSAKRIAVSKIKNHLESSPLNTSETIELDRDRVGLFPTNYADRVHSYLKPAMEYHCENIGQVLNQTKNNVYDLKCYLESRDEVVQDTANLATNRAMNYYYDSMERVDMIKTAVVSFTTGSAIVLGHHLLSKERELIGDVMVGSSQSDFEAPESYMLVGLGVAVAVALVNVVSSVFADKHMEYVRKQCSDAVKAELLDMRFSDHVVRTKTSNIISDVKSLKDDAMMVKQNLVEDILEIVSGVSFELYDKKDMLSDLATQHFTLDSTESSSSNIPSWLERHIVDQSMFCRYHDWHFEVVHEFDMKACLVSIELIE